MHTRIARGPDFACVRLTRRRLAADSSARRGKLRGGFSLVEAMVALSLTAIAGSVLLLATESSVSIATEAVDQTIAAGMAEQLIDEVLGCRYNDEGASPHQTPLGPSSAEQLGPGRTQFDDTDDFNGFSASAPQDVWGKPLGAGDDEGELRHPHFRVNGALLANWRQEVEVYYVDNNDPTRRLAAGVTSNFRTVEVRISKRQTDGSMRTLAQLRRVIAYVPTPQ